MDSCNDICMNAQVRVERTAMSILQKASAT